MRRHLLDYGKKRLQPGRPLREVLQRLGVGKHFIGIARYSLPAEVANAIDNLRRTGSGVSQVAAMEDQVGRSLLQIREDCLKRGSVAVDVGDDRDAHHR